MVPDDLEGDLQLAESIIDDSYVENTVRLQNIVATASFNMSIDLPSIAWMYKSDYSPSSFAAAQIKLKVPEITALIFSTGKLVVTGAHNENVSRTCVQIFYHMIKAVHPEIEITETGIRNIVASCQLSSYIDLEKLFAAYPISSHYAPSLFPGLRFKLHEPRCKVLLFVKGRIVITGCNNREDVARAYQQIKAIIDPYLSTTPITHDGIAQQREANKKRRLVEDEEEDAF
jgi:transcription initiation factor TFIID TATA-box-binding protein